MLSRNITIVNIKKKKKKTFLNNESFLDNLLRYIGQTITIFTVSGGEAGSGFTGVLFNVSKDHLKLITEVASPPDCKLEDNISLGSITDIPIDKIVAFVHNST